ncbi:MAG: biotin carboxylase N-terminal domain-containing protein [Vicinamibacterales bacterium]
MFRRILIAARGEIAVRVIRTCRALGIESIAVYSDADAGAPHVALADRAIRIGPASPAESYLSIDAILDAALEAKAEAIHPGYGFLSENPTFARMCVERGVRFIGPPADAIERMGSKIAARHLAREAGVSVVPGETPSDQSNAAIAVAAMRLGLPVVLKPSAGGGGMGMKVVPNASTLPGAIEQARREALAAFGDGTLYVERLINRPRHVEFQVFGDDHGHVVHLFERECSIQRRHQKVVEESPSPALTAGLRRRMADAAVALTRAAGYQNAGTVEFLLEGTGDATAFYFLEMNTRLQVEHPVTELAVGVDLVHAQLLVAAGEPLPWTQEALAQRGHTIEVRVYAEDPSRGHLPQAGPLLLYREPSMPGIRVDGGMTEGGEITVHYDPMIAKLISTGESRESARLRAIAALRSFPILGIRTNVPFLIALLEHPRFVSGDINTGFLDAEADAISQVVTSAPPEALALATLVRATSHTAASAGTGTSAGKRMHLDPWISMRGFRLEAHHGDLDTLMIGSSHHRTPIPAAVPSLGAGAFSLATSAGSRLAWAVATGRETWVFLDGRVHVIPVGGAGAARRRGLDNETALAAPMPATVVTIHVVPGQQVVRGDVMIRLEAMKMELPIVAPRDARVKSVPCRLGELVQPGVPLVELEPEHEPKSENREA